MTDFQEIKRMACNITGIEPSDLDTRSRKGLIPFTRYLIIWGLMRMQRITLQRAAMLVGYPERNAHSSAIFGLKQIENYHTAKQHPHAVMYAIFQDAIIEKCCQYKGKVTAQGLEITSECGLYAIYSCGWLTIRMHGQTCFDGKFEKQKIDRLVALLNYFNNIKR